MLKRLFFAAVATLICITSTYAGAFDDDDFDIDITQEDGITTAYASYDYALKSNKLPNKVYFEAFVCVDADKNRAGVSIFLDFLSECFKSTRTDSLLMLTFGNGDENLVLFDYPNDNSYAHQLVLQSFDKGEKRTRNQLVCDNMSLLASKNITKVTDGKETIEILEPTAPLFRELFDRALREISDNGASTSCYNGYINRKATTSKKQTQSEKTKPKAATGSNDKPDNALMKMLCVPLGKDVLKVDLTNIKPAAMQEKLKLAGYKPIFDYWDYALLKVKFPNVSICGHDVDMWWLKMEIPQTEMCYRMNFGSEKTALDYAAKLAKTLVAGGIALHESDSNYFLKIYNSEKTDIYVSKNSNLSADVSLHINSKRTFSKSLYHKEMTLADVITHPFGISEIDVCSPTATVESEFVDRLYPGTIIEKPGEKNIHTKYGNDDKVFSISVPLSYSPQVRGLKTNRMDYVERGTARYYMVEFELDAINAASLTFNRENEITRNIFRNITKDYKKGKTKQLKALGIDTDWVKECRSVTEGSLTRYYLLELRSGSYRISVVSVCN